MSVNSTTMNDGLKLQGLQPEIIITKILEVFEDWEYIEGLKQKFELIKEFSRSPSLVQV